MADAAQERHAVIDDAVAAALLAFTNAQAAITTTGDGAGTGATSFTLTPALANTGFLDFSKTKGLKLFNKATEKLDFIFQGKPDQVLLLTQAIRNKAILW